MKKISLIASALLVTASSAFADSASIKDAFQNGKVEGNIALFSKTIDAKGGTKDAGYNEGSIGLSYKTDSVNNFSAKMGFRAYHTFSEKNDGDSREDFSKEARSLMTEASIKYEDANVTAIVGRQEIDLEWMGDYNEAALLSTEAIKDTLITAAYSQRKATADETEVGQFEHVTNENGKKIDGEFVLDVKYNGIEGLELNPYAYSASDLANFYGFKAIYGSEYFGFVAHYAESDEDVSTVKDGSILNLEVSTEFAGLAVAAGYVQTDKDGAIGSMDKFGDNINPMDSGNQWYSQNAETWYGILGYNLAGVDLGLYYSDTKYDTDSAKGDREKETNFTVDYSFTDEFSATLLLADVNAQAEADDQNYATLTLMYSF